MGITYVRTKAPRCWNIEGPLRAYGSMLAVLEEPAVKPFAEVVRGYLSCDSGQKRE